MKIRCFLTAASVIFLMGCASTSMRTNGFDHQREYAASRNEVAGALRDFFTSHQIAFKLLDDNWGFWSTVPTYTGETNSETFNRYAYCENKLNSRDYGEDIARVAFWVYVSNPVELHSRTLVRVRPIFLAPEHDSGAFGSGFLECYSKGVFEKAVLDHISDNVAKFGASG